jgi:hypothetical protein
MSSIPRNHDPASENPPEKYKPSREKGKGNRRHKGGFYTEEYKDWFAYQTKDIDVWKDYVLFCRKHKVDPQNSHQWRKQRYPDLWPAKPKSPVRVSKNASKEDLKKALDASRKQVKELNQKLADTDVGEAMKLAEEAEQKLTRERKWYESQIKEKTEDLEDAKLQVQELLSAAASAGAKSKRELSDKYSKLSKEHTALQKKHNALVKQCRECEEKTAHHQDVLAALSSLQREKGELDEELATLRASLADDPAEEALVRKEQVLNLLKKESGDLREEVAQLTAQLARDTKPVDDVTISTVFWAGALSTGTMPDPIEAGVEIRRLIERMRAGDL